LLKSAWRHWKYAKLTQILIGWASGPGDAAGEQLDAGDEEPRLGAFDGRFEVFGEAAIAIEPGDGALDDPSSRQRLAALGGVGAPDDVEGPGAKLSEGLAKLAAGIAAVGEDMAQPWERASHGSEQQRGAVAILNVGAMYDGRDEQPQANGACGR
jgi:hypothetical protein